MQTETSPPRRTFKDYLVLIARGFAMGAADIVPGVSGGTMAFILGIYDELIESISAINLPFLRRIFTFRWRDALASFPWAFLLSVAAGIFLAVFSLSNGLHWALEHHPALIWGFFFGLILASIWVVRGRVARWSPAAIAAAVLAAVAAFSLVGITPAHTPATPFFFFISGAFAICAMILPGVSGAFILVLLGKYQQVLNAVISFDWFPLAVLMSGSVVGLLFFANLLRWLLRWHHDLTVAALIGFLIGSLRKVWPWKVVTPLAEGSLEYNILPTLNTETSLSLGLMLLGMGLVLLMERLAVGHKSPARH